MRLARSLTALGLIALGFLFVAPGEASAFWWRHAGPYCYGPCCYGPPPFFGYCPPMPIIYGGCWPVPCYPACYTACNIAPGCMMPQSTPSPQALPPTPSMTPARPMSLKTAALLELDVPAEARVFVNDLATRATGTHRQFVSPGLVPGLSYTFQVRVELPGKQQPVVETKTIKLQAGEKQLLAFGLAAGEPIAAATAAPLPTSLTLHVPADAQVFLGGNRTTTLGPVRTYSTMLPAGERLDRYTVRVQFERDGKVVAREQTIALAAGETRELKFDFATESAPALAASK